MSTRPRLGRGAEILIRYAGALPPREAKVRILRLARTLRVRLAEELEVLRARRALRSRATAQTVVVIPTIGRDRLIAAVRSALGQTVDDLHVVVVSDGQPLPPLPDDPRLSVVRLRRRYSVAAMARNVGVRASTSRYLAFLDDDNTWRPDHLAQLVPVVAGGAALAYSALEWIDDDGRPLGTMSVPFDRARLRDENYVDTSTIALPRSRRARFRVVPRRRGDATFEDWELAWRVSRRARVVHVPATTVRVRVHDGQQFVPRVRLAAPGAAAAPAEASVVVGG